MKAELLAEFAKRIDELRGEILFNEELDEEFDKFSEQYFILALTNMDAAARHMKLASMQQEDAGAVRKALQEFDEARKKFGGS